MLKEGEKRLKKFKISLCLILIIFVLTGCYDRGSSNSLGKMSIVQGVGIDLIDSDTKVSLQYLDLNKGANSVDSLNGNITANATGTSQSIADAMATTSRALSQEIFLGQNKLIVFGFDYAQNDLEKGLDYLLRSVASRPDVAVALSSDEAEKIITNKNESVRVPVENVFDLLQLGEKNGLGAVVTVNDLLNLYSDLTSDMYLPMLTVKDDTVICDGIAVFSDCQYKSTLKNEQCFGFLFVENKIEGGTIVVDDNELGIVGVEIVSSKTNKYFEIDNNTEKFVCEINTKIMLDEIEKGISTSVTDDKIQSIENAVGDKIKFMCKSAVKQCYENQSDPFMTGKYAARYNFDYYENVKDNWRENLKNISTDIMVKVELVRVNDNSIRS